MQLSNLEHTAHTKVLGHAGERELGDCATWARAAEVPDFFDALREAFFGDRAGVHASSLRKTLENRSELQIYLETFRENYTAT